MKAQHTEVYAIQEKQYPEGIFSYKLLKNKKQKTRISQINNLIFYLKNSKKNNFLNRKHIGKMK